MLETPFGNGTLLDVIEQMIESIPDATQRRAARSDWEDGQEIKRDFPLVQPDMGEQVGVRVVDPGVDDPDDGRGRAGETVRPGLSGLAAIGVRDRRRIAVHAPQPAAGIAGIGADRCDRRHPQVDRGHLMRLGQTRLIGIPGAIGGTA